MLNVTSKTGMARNKALDWKGGDSMAVVYLYHDVDSSKSLG